ncbi:MAG: D-alanine--D-alanine ligase [Candidatus Portnoybacteria bacterium]|nr:D-alanine--D-alanine ligase [Candidatus Portnoybacteria bacterium]
MKKIRLALLSGGNSAEREVSLKTGEMIKKNLDPKKYEVFLFDPAKDLKKLTEAIFKKRVDVVFPALHGPGGEDGRLQGFLETLGVSFAFSGVLASALAMDKEMTKKIFRREKIPTPKYFVFSKNGHLSLKKTFFPCVVKPAAQGSSIGITLAQGPGQLKAALKKALRFSTKALVEEYIEGREITAGVLGNQKPEALPLVEIRPRCSSFFDFRAKYEKGGSEEVCPANIAPALAKKIRDLAVRLHQALGCRGASRTDFILRGNQIFVLEINTIPGMTKTSLLPQAASKAGIGFSALLDRIIELALEN